MFKTKRKKWIRKKLKILFPGTRITIKIASNGICSANIAKKNYHIVDEIENDTIRLINYAEEEKMDTYCFKGGNLEKKEYTRVNGTAEKIFIQGLGYYQEDWEFPQNE